MSNMDSSGFYKRDGDVLLHGPNFVLHADFQLRRETRDEHTYPTDGWHWFDSEAEALAFFGLEPITGA